MCDYSLCGLPNRLAIEGEELVVHRFRSGSMGLASPAELSPAKSRSGDPRPGLWGYIKSLFEDFSSSPVVTAVCVPPGAQLILKSIPEDLQRQWKTREEERVFFVQISANVNSYRDAVRFRNGREVLLQCLREGMRVQIVSLGDATSGSTEELDSEKVFAI